MNTLLVIEKHIEKRDVLLFSIKENVTVMFTKNVSSASLNKYDRIGFLYHQSDSFPFTLDDRPSEENYFSREWKEYFEANKKVVDLISCNYSVDISTLFDKLLLSVINYSDDITGIEPLGDWILEKSTNSGTENVNIKDVYFLESINDWDVTLGPIGGDNLIIDEYGDVYQFGRDHVAVLTPTKVGGTWLPKVVRCATGSVARYFVTVSGEVYAFGANSNSQLGLGYSSTYVNAPTKVDSSYFNNIEIVEIATGQGNVFALDKNGKMYCLGSNAFGCLGLGNYDAVTVFTDAFDTTYIGNNKIKSVSMGSIHTFIIDETNVCYSVGQNGYGQLGQGNNTNLNIFTPINTSNLLSDVKYVSCGEHYNLLLDINGNVYSCGKNNYGQLGHNDTTNRNIFTLIEYFSTNNIVISAIYSTQFVSIFLDVNGDVYTCGQNGGDRKLGQNLHSSIEYKALPVKLNKSYWSNKKIVKIAGSQSSCMLLTEDGDVYTFGAPNTSLLGRSDGVNYNHIPGIIDETNIGTKKIVDLKETNYEIDFSLKLANQDLTGQDFTTVNLFGATTGPLIASTELLPVGYKTIISDTQIWIMGKGVKGENADFNGADFAGLDLTSANLSTSNLIGCNTGPLINGTNNLPDGYFTVSGDFEIWIIGPGVNLTGANMAGMDISGIDMSGVIINNTKAGSLKSSTHKLPSGYTTLSGEFEIWLNGQGVDFTGANLNGISLSEVNVNAKITKNVVQNFITTVVPEKSKVVFGNYEIWIITSGAILDGANMGGMDLSGVDLSNVDLTNANLKDCKTGPLLGTTHLLPPGYKTFVGSTGEIWVIGPGVDLTDADLNGINLFSENLSGVKTGPLKSIPSRIPLSCKIYDNNEKWILGPGVNLTGATLSGQLINLNLTGSNITKADFTKTILQNVRLNNVILESITDFKFESKYKPLLNEDGSNTIFGPGLIVRSSGEIYQNQWNLHSNNIDVSLNKGDIFSVNADDTRIAFVNI